jgi:uncharacterized delta-60 repeat protein
MGQEKPGYQRMVSSGRRFRAAVRCGGGVGVLAGLLLLPLHVWGLESGDLDSCFGGDGIVRTDLGSRNFDEARAVAIQADGKIVVAGWSFTASGGRDFALARYLSNGTLDTTFSGDGTVLTDFGSGSEDQASALALQPKGKIVLAGVSNEDFALARYLPNGTLDTSFSGDGKVTTDFGVNAWASALAIQPHYGRLVVAGRSYTASTLEDFALARYHAIACTGVVATQGGTAGNDTLVGGTGDDTVVGDTGTDVCEGGARVQGDRALGCESVTGVP